MADKPDGAEWALSPEQCIEVVMKRKGRNVIVKKTRGQQYFIYDKTTRKPLCRPVASEPLAWQHAAGRCLRRSKAGRPPKPPGEAMPVTVHVRFKKEIAEHLSLTLKLLVDRGELPASATLSDAVRAVVHQGLKNLEGNGLYG